MDRVLWALLVTVTVTVRQHGCQSPDWVWNNGQLLLTVSDMPGVVNITVRVHGDSGHGTTMFIGHKSADGSWKAAFPDIVDHDIIHYVIGYMFLHQQHDVRGSLNLNNRRPPNLSSERYLQRRATTVFFDDFSSGHIDSQKWTHDIMAVGTSSGHFQMWTPESQNSYVKNGVLYIKPTFTVDRFGQNILEHGTIDVRQIWGACHPNWGSLSCVTHGQQNRPIMSALIRSTASIRYGKVEVVAQLPKGDWLWPAIWMMPKDSHYGGWPRSGEIDIMEATGNLHLRHPNGNSVGVDCDFATIHYGNGRGGSQHARHGGQYRISGTTFGDGYHTYWLDWTENYIRIGVDSHTVLAVDTSSEGFWNEGHLQGDNIWADGGKNAPFDRAFYLILNVAVGDGFFWKGYINSPYAMPWTEGASDDYRQFWKARHLWQPTWHGDDVALKVRSVKMQQY